MQHCHPPDIIIRKHHAVFCSSCTEISKHHELLQFVQNTTESPRSLILSWELKKTGWKTTVFVLQRGSLRGEQLSSSVWDCSVVRSDPESTDKHTHTQTRTHTYTHAHTHTHTHTHTLSLSLSLSLWKFFPILCAIVSHRTAAHELATSEVRCSAAVPCIDRCAWSIASFMVRRRGCTIQVSYHF